MYSALSYILCTPAGRSGPGTLFSLSHHPHDKLAELFSDHAPMLLPRRRFISATTCENARTWLFTPTHWLLAAAFPSMCLGYPRGFFRFAARRGLAERRMASLVGSSRSRLGNANSLRTRQELINTFVFNYVEGYNDYFSANLSVWL